ncbi:hypothetical protein MKX01_015010 [Papaver californicum]|nr:hypothetical protein MKX01_015010 [Papaver californicum]
MPDTSAHIAEELSNGVEVHGHLNNEEEVVVQEEVVEEPPQVQLVQIEVRQMAEPAGPVVQEDAPKKSYAAVLKVTKGNAGRASMNMPATTIKVKPAIVGQKAPAPAAPTPAHGASAPNSNNVSANNNVWKKVTLSFVLMFMRHHLLRESLLFLMILDHRSMNFYLDWMKQVNGWSFQMLQISWEAES